MAHKYFDELSVGAFAKVVTATWYCPVGLYDDVILALKEECGTGACITVSYFDDQIITQNVVPLIAFGLGMGVNKRWSIKLVKKDVEDDMITLEVT